MFQFLSLLPAILALVGFIAQLLLRRTQDHKLVQEVLSKIRAQGPIDIEAYSQMTPSRLKAILETDSSLRRSLGKQDFELLKQTLRQHFVTQIIVYILLLVVFVFGVGTYVYEKRQTIIVNPTPESRRAQALQEIYGDDPRVRAEAVRKYVDLERARLSDKRNRNSLLDNYIDLHDTSLISTTLEHADLRRVSFRKADLTRANLNNTELEQASFRFTIMPLSYLLFARVNDAQFFMADLAGAKLSSASLQHVLFSGCRMKAADLSDADLSHASFVNSDLRLANLANIQNWQSIETVKGSNFYGVSKAPPGFLEWIKQHGGIIDEGRPDDFEAKRAQAIDDEEG